METSKHYSSHSWRRRIPRKCLLFGAVVFLGCSPDIRTNSAPDFRISASSEGEAKFPDEADLAHFPPLSEFSADLVETILLEEGMELGYSIARGYPQGLTGTWTGIVRDDASGLEREMRLTFGEEGVLTQLAIFSNELIETAVSFDESVNVPSEITTHSLAAVLTTDGGFECQLTALVAMDDAGTTGDETIQIIKLECTFDTEGTSFYAHVERTTIVAHEGETSEESVSETIEVFGGTVLQD
jgi:hypothetical protein